MPVVVQFLGRSGSGKSTLLASLASQLGESRCVQVKNSKPPVSTRLVKLRAMLRVARLMRLFLRSDIWTRSQKAKRRTLRRAAFAMGLNTSDLRRKFSRAEFIFLDELGAVGFFSFLMPLKRRHAIPNEELFARCVDDFGLPDVLIYMRVSHEVVLARRLARARRYDMAWLEETSREKDMRVLEESDDFVAWVRDRHPRVRIIEVDDTPDVAVIVREIENVAADREPGR